MVTFYWVYNCLGIQDHPRMIYQKGSGNIRDEPTETTLHAITKEPTESLLGNSCKLKLIITEVKSPDDWCYMSCMDCWKKTVPSSTTARKRWKNRDRPLSQERWRSGPKNLHLEPRLLIILIEKKRRCGQVRWRAI